jgi:hypothetical protein
MILPANAAERAAFADAGVRPDGVRSARPYLLETPMAEFLLTIQGEAFTLWDDDDDTAIRVPGSPEPTATLQNSGEGRIFDESGLRRGYTGEGYIDMGGDPGDGVSFVVNAPVAGAYEVTARYGNGSGQQRPMSVLVGDDQQTSVSFSPTGSWESWGEVTFTVNLTAGENTVYLVQQGSNGPNIDAVEIFREGTGPSVEPGDRFEVKINFQPALDSSVRNPSFITPSGYVADTGEQFGQLSFNENGQSWRYGWVTQASIADGTANGTAPMPIRYMFPDAVNDRTDEIPGVDPRQGTYAHFNNPAYAQAAGWEMELPSGFYEVTISLGDTRGPYDSFYLLRAEGQVFNDPFAPFRPADFPPDSNPSNDSDGFRSDLVTRVVQVTDGRLTLDAIGPGSNNVEIQYLEVQSLPDLTPANGVAAPADYALFTNPRAISGSGPTSKIVRLDPENGNLPTGVDPDSDFFLGISVVEGRGGALLESLVDGSIKLFETLTGVAVPFTANTTGGFDSITISPSVTLKPFTSYSLAIDGFRDRGENGNQASATREFLKFSETFITGAVTAPTPSQVAFAGRIELNGATDDAYGFTSVEIAPGGRHLYVSTISGEIKRFDVDPNTGALSNGKPLLLDYFQDASGPRGIIGLAADPLDPNVLWVTDNYPVPLNGRDDGVPDFSGRVSKITITDQANFAATATPYITGLPRSNGDHVSNSLEFRKNPAYNGVTNPDAPPFLLYLTQGSNTAMGGVDSAWGSRPERLLSGTVLEIDPSRTAPVGGFDVTTEPLPPDGLNRRFEDDDNNPKDDPIPIGNGTFLVFAANGTATVRDASGTVLQSFYNPFAPDSVVKIFADGTRNAYDLVWHSNGSLYVPTNGSAANGVVPDDPATAINEGLAGVALQNDYLFRVVQGGYYGHPSPLRDNFILNGGNPTAGVDKNEVVASGGHKGYPVGIQPDPDYRGEDAYSLGQNRSPNGVTEFTSNVFGSLLKGSLLFTEYSGGDDIRVIKIGANGQITGDDVLRDVNGNVIRYVDPLDIVENPLTGQLYLITLNRNTGQSQLVRLDPILSDTPPVRQSLLTIQAEDNTPGDGTAVAIASAASGGQITIRDMAHPEPNPFYPGLINGLRPGAYGLDGDTDDNDGLTGGYADFGATNADFITFTFNVTAAQAGAGILQFRYANGASTDRPLEVRMNGADIGDLSFAPPGSPTGDAAWSTWQITEIPVALAAGSNTVTLRAIAGAGPNIDQLEVLRLNQTPAGSFLSVQAEDRTPGDGTSVTLASPASGAQIAIRDMITPEPNPFYPGLVNGLRPGAYGTDGNNNDNDGLTGGYVDFGSTNTDFVTFTFNVTAAQAGASVMQVRYANGASSSRMLGVEVNGASIGNQPFAPPSPPQGDAGWSAWQLLDVPVNLVSGTNTVTFRSVNNTGPNIDQIEFFKSGVPTDPVVYYEAEGASLAGGAAVATANAGFRGTGYVDFAGPATNTITFTVNAPSAGIYELDFGYALQAGRGDRQVGLALNGTAVGTLYFDDVSTSLSDWEESTKLLELNAGTNFITLRSPGGLAPNLDYLKVEKAALQGGGNPNADVVIQSRDAAYFDNRVHFSWLDNNSAFNPNRDYKESGQFGITNTGSQPLQILDWEIDGPFALANPGQLDGLTIGAGQTINVRVNFDRAAYTRPANNTDSGLAGGKLELITNDAEDPLVTVDLAGFWQAQDEGSWEPNVNEVWEVFGFGNYIPGIPTIDTNPNSPLNHYDIVEQVTPDEVLSRFWRIADGHTQATITQLAALHGNGGGEIAIHSPSGNIYSNSVSFGLSATNNNQTLLPIRGNGEFVVGSFSNATIPDAWTGNDVFAFRVDNMSSNDPVNGRGPRPSPNGEPQGHFLRFFQAYDQNGAAVPDTYLLIQDYSGINYDYNDNMFVIEGIAPAVV